jgi:hypothetical protein
MRCQVEGCAAFATFHSFPSNAVHPDEGGMQTCNDHLYHGMSVIAGQSDPEYWRVFPLLSESQETREVADGLSATVTPTDRFNRED